jgi:hypothetical protein
LDNVRLEFLSVALFQFSVAVVKTLRHGDYGKIIFQQRDKGIDASSLHIPYITPITTAMPQGEWLGSLRRILFMYYDITVRDKTRDR